MQLFVLFRVVSYVIDCLSVFFKNPSAEGIFDAVNAEKTKQEQKERQKFQKSNTRKFN